MAPFHLKRRRVVKDCGNTLEENACVPTIDVMPPGESPVELLFACAFGVLKLVILMELAEFVASVANAPASPPSSKG